MRPLLYGILVFLMVQGTLRADNKQVVTSPDGKLQLAVTAGEQLTYQILLDGQAITQPAAIGMTIRGKKAVGQDAEIVSVDRSTVNTTIPVLFGENDEISDHYNEMNLNLGDYHLICRAYDEGVAYRFETNYRGGILVEKELVEFIPQNNPIVHLAYEEPPRTMSHWELPYSKLNSIDDIPVGDYAINPLMLKDKTTGLGITIVESDVDDYPGMYILRADNSRKLVGKFAEYPDKIDNPDKWASQKVLTRKDYIANTKGTRLFPWRGFIITRQDKELLNNDLIYKLARPQELDDTSWIKPGKTSWEWLHEGELEGVNFPKDENGNFTFEFYKYYIDFAADNGLEYMTLDAGWNDRYIEQVCSYAAGRGVKIFVWTYFNFVLVDEQMLARFKQWGISGVKADFIARDDQVATEWVETMAKRCAKYQLMLLPHGCAKPTGLHRTYPNIVNYEGVVGEEHNKWNDQCNPVYRATFPFLRMLGGPADITPGSLRNKTKLGFKVLSNGAPNTLGTRAHQLAMYVICHQTLGFLSDAPTEYAKHPEAMEFLKPVPTVWNETLPLAGEVGEHILMARRSDNDWYVGGITNWTERKQMEVNLSFLQEGVKYKAYLITDDPTKNNDKGFRAGDATASNYETIEVTAQTTLKIDMAQGGGMAMHIYPDPDGSAINIDKHPDVTAWYDTRSQNVSVSTRGNRLQLTLSDLPGRGLQTRIVEGEVTISTANLAPGMYIITLKGTDRKGEQIQEVLKFRKQ